MKPYDTSTTPELVKEISWMQCCDNGIVAALAILRQTWLTRTNQTLGHEYCLEDYHTYSYWCGKEDSTLGINISDRM